MYISTESKWAISSIIVLSTAGSTPSMIPTAQDQILSGNAGIHTDIIPQKLSSPDEAPEYQYPGRSLSGRTRRENKIPKHPQLHRARPSDGLGARTILQRHDSASSASSTAESAGSRQGLHSQHWKRQSRYQSRRPRSWYHMAIRRYYLRYFATTGGTGLDNGVHIGMDCAWD